MTTKALARIADVSQADAANFTAGRHRKLSLEKIVRLKQASLMSQNDVVEWHLRNIGTLTPLVAARDYLILRLSARVYDLNNKYARKGKRFRIVNIRENLGSIGNYAEYKIKKY